LCSKYVYSPTVTIVTREATVLLTTTECQYERSTTLHDDWFNCLKNKLHFGNCYYRYSYQRSAFRGHFGMHRGK